MLLFFILTALQAQISLQESLPISPRVMGGDYAQSGKYPYHVALLVNRQYNCGGAIISKTFILTAAHCTDGFSPSQITVKAGTIDLRTNDGITVLAQEFFEHPQYNRKTFDFDLSLIRLRSPLKLGTATINKIELSTAPLDLPEGTVAILTGFGHVSGEPKISPRLKYANVFVWPRKRCNDRFVSGVTDHMICTGHPAGGISSCKGDSGGPLTVDNKLYGVVSWGYSCANKNAPSMHAYVGAALDWIKQVAGV